MTSFNPNKNSIKKSINTLACCQKFYRTSRPPDQKHKPDRITVDVSAAMLSPPPLNPFVSGIQHKQKKIDKKGRRVYYFANLKGKQRQTTLFTISYFRKTKEKNAV